jgi:hypothetical protein
MKNKILSLVGLSLTLVGCGSNFTSELRIKNFVEHHEKTLGVLEKQLSDCTSHCGIYKNTVKSQRLKLSNFKKLSLDQQAQDADQNCINGTFYRTCVDSTQNKKYF